MPFGMPWIGGDDPDAHEKRSFLANLMYVAGSMQGGEPFGAIGNIMENNRRDRVRQGQAQELGQAVSGLGGDLGPLAQKVGEIGGDPLAFIPQILKQRQRQERRDAFSKLTKPDWMTDEQWQKAQYMGKLGTDLDADQTQASLDTIFGIAPPDPWAGAKKQAYDDRHALSVMDQAGTRPARQQGPARPEDPAKVARGLSKTADANARARLREIKDTEEWPKDAAGADLPYATVFKQVSAEELARLREQATSVPKTPPPGADGGGVRDDVVKRIGELQRSGMKDNDIARFLKEAGADPAAYGFQ